MRRPILFAFPAVLVAAGCGSGAPGRAGNEASTVQVVASAAFLADSADRTIDSRTGHVDITVGLGAITFKASGEYDTDAGQAALSIDMSAMIDAIMAGGEVPDEVRDMFDDPIDLVVDQTTIYMRFPALVEALGVESDWLELDLAAATGGADLFSSDATGGLGGMTDPAAYIDFLRGASDNITAAGSEQIDGVETTHLYGTISLQRSMDQLPPEDRAAYEDFLRRSGVGSLVDEEVPFDVWVDGQGLVRRIEIAFAMPATEELAIFGGRLFMRVDYSDFGDDVSIEVPEDAVDMASLMPSGG
jgi:hypothetical protein